MSAHSVGPARMLVAVAVIVVVVAAGCSSSTGPKSAAVDGLWTGNWNSTAATLDLTGSGSNLTGWVHVGAESLSVSGSVSSTGAALWASGVDSIQCAEYATGSAGLSLNSAGDTLSGVVQRASGQMVCNPSAGGLIQVQQGLMVVGHSGS